MLIRTDGKLSEFRMPSSQALAHLRALDERDRRLRPHAAGIE